MDPQSQSFTPYNNSQDSWRLQADVARLQQVQQEHSERLARLERKQDDDARIKSVWGNSSPFPSVLSGTPQQGEMVDQRWGERSLANDFIKYLSSSHLWNSIVITTTKQAI